jgi:hypothetical protein
MAEELAIPIEEIESLVFGLVGSFKSINEIIENREQFKLRLV